MIGLVSCLANADVRAVRIAGNGDPTRIIIDADARHEYSVFLEIVGDERAIVVDLPGAHWTGARPSAAERGGIVSYDWQGERLRFVLDRPLMISQRLDLPPTGDATSHRIVLDLSTVSPTRFDRKARHDMRKLAELDAIPKPTLAAQAPGKRVIVLDPGHGGKDPGTTISSRVSEKETVLEVAKLIAASFKDDERFEVRLTRDDDTFIELEDRVTLARNWGADLFISLHADSAGNAEVEGAAVYTLSSKGEGRVDETARDNNWYIPIETGVESEEVADILETLVKRETLSNSAKFAAVLLPELAASGPVVRRSHRQGNYFVLLAPDVPAVIVELGFLSNAADARRLGSARGRRRAAGAITDGIRAYFDNQDRLLAQN